MHNGSRMLAVARQVLLIVGLATLSACATKITPTEPADYQIIWTFVNNTQSPVMMFGIDLSAGNQNCQDGTACSSTTPTVSLVANDSKATSSFGPGTAVLANLTAHVVGVNATGVLNGVLVLSGSPSSVTARWDGTNITITAGHS